MAMQELGNRVFQESMAAIGTIVPLELIETTGRVAELVIGNGIVATQYIADLIVQAKEEVIFSTCFWASSLSLSALHNALITLNNRARNDGRRVTVRILFSSCSFRQKFLSIKGVRKWKSHTWGKLGLPNPARLGSLDLTVLSRFRKPFGIMHAKFVIIDRAVVVLPSSNISCTSFCFPISC